MLGERKKKENESGQGAFIPRARHALLAVLRGIFVAVRRN
jgi:hypothetical protein